MSEGNERTLFEHFEIGHLERLQVTGLETDVRVLCSGIGVVLCRQRNNASVCKEHSVFLHGARYHLSCRFQMRDIIVGLKAKVGAIRRTEGRPARATVMGGGVNKNASADALVGQNKPNRVINMSHREFVRAEQEWSNRVSSGVCTGALIAPPRRRINAIEVPNGQYHRGDGPAVEIGGKGLVELPVVAVHRNVVAVLLFDGTLVAIAVFHASSSRKRNRRGLVGGNDVSVLCQPERNSWR